MGISHEVYVGPYVRCAVERRERTVWRSTCPNGACPNNGRRVRDGERFCVMCGTAITSVADTESVDAVDYWELSESINERMCRPAGDAYGDWRDAEGAHLWLPNVNWGGRGGHVDMRLSFDIDTLAAEQVTREVMEFANFFAPEILAFTKAYGEGAVTVRWGIIKHCYH